MTRFHAIALAAALALSACVPVVPTTAARLATMNPLTADPGQIQVALVLPPGLQVTPGSAVLRLEARRGTQSKGEDFVLVPVPAPDASATGFATAKDATVVGFAVAQGDLARMRALQAEIATWKAEGRAEGSLSIGLGGCAVNGGPAKDSTGAVLIRLALDEPFRPLIRPQRLSALLGPKGLAEIKPCGGQQ